MSDRDKPNYNPESSGDIDDYWASSASFRRTSNERTRAIGPINNKTEWLRVYAKGIAESIDDDDFLLEHLREKTIAWTGPAIERQMMLKLLNDAGDLLTYWQK